MTEIKLSNILNRVPEGMMLEVFAEPWQADTFALMVSLQAQGLFTWEEWSVALGQQIQLGQASGDPDLGDTYYEHVLRALEGLLKSKGFIDERTLSEHVLGWERACERTPHGEPIVLEKSDLIRE
jgi:nitrile hydratase accessory protein